MGKLRLGTIVKDHTNVLMLVSPNYEAIAKRLAQHTYRTQHTKLLACLVLSQTEEQYKKYMILVLQGLQDIEQNLDTLITSWQENRLNVRDEDFKHLLTYEEYALLHGKDLETKLDKYPQLFNDGFNMVFYPTMKKGMVYWRRLAESYFKTYHQLTQYQKLLLHFITAQMLVSWESSCIDSSLMLLDDWTIEDMAERFDTLWPVYRSQAT